MQLIEKIAQTILDRGLIPGDIIDNYGVLRDAGFTPDEIAAHYDEAAMIAFKRAVNEINHFWPEVRAA